LSRKPVGNPQLSLYAAIMRRQRELKRQHAPRTKPTPPELVAGTVRRGKPR
jgi:hypothetical protein